MKAKRILTVAAAAALIITSVFAGGNFTKVLKSRVEKYSVIQSYSRIARYCQGARHRKIVFGRDRFFPGRLRQTASGDL